MIFLNQKHAYDGSCMERKLECMVVCTKERGKSLKMLIGRSIISRSIDLSQSPITKVAIVVSTDPFPCWIAY